MENYPHTSRSRLSRVLPMTPPFFPRISFISKTLFFSLSRPARLRLLSNHTPGYHLLFRIMPAPSRSSSKRKIECDEESDPEVGISQSSQISKKIRKEKSFASENSQPTNKVLPVEIVLPEKLSGISRVVTWNVSGFAASMKKVSTRFSRVIAYFDPSDFCRASNITWKQRIQTSSSLPKQRYAEQEALLCTLKYTGTNAKSYLTQLQQPPADPSLTTRFPHQYWSSSATKGYGKSPFFSLLLTSSDNFKRLYLAGTAILSKLAPLSTTDTIPGHPNPTSVKGRIVTLEFDKCYLVGTYVVNAGQGLKVHSIRQNLRTYNMTNEGPQTLDEKKIWNTHFFSYLRDLDQKKPVIWAGDFNVAPTEIGTHLN